MTLWLYLSLAFNFCTFFFFHSFSIHWGLQALFMHSSPATSGLEVNCTWAIATLHFFFRFVNVLETIVLLHGLIWNKL